MGSKNKIKMKSILCDLPPVWPLNAKDIARRCVEWRQNKRDGHTQRLGSFAYRMTAESVLIQVSAESAVRRSKVLGRDRHVFPCEEHTHNENTASRSPVRGDSHAPNGMRVPVHVSRGLRHRLIKPGNPKRRSEAVGEPVPLAHTSVQVPSNKLKANAHAHTKRRKIALRWGQVLRHNFTRSR